MFVKLCLVAFFCIAYTATLGDSLTIIKRAQWGARKAKWLSPILSVNPPSHVAIHHSASASCTTKAKCTSLVKSFQNMHMDTNKWNDIGYNFLVGEDGNVYEGQGWGRQGAHAIPVNAKSIGICVIGTFTKRAPSAAAQKAVKDLIAYGVKNGKIRSNYKLVGHRQVDATECPGLAFYNVIKKWPHWASKA